MLSTKSFQVAYKANYDYETYMNNQSNPNALSFIGDERSLLYFTNLGQFYRAMDEITLGQQVASFQCLIVLLKEDNLVEGMKLVDFIVDLEEASVRRKNKHFILITKNVDYGLLQNRTGNVNVHIISQREYGRWVLIVSVTISFLTKSYQHRQRP